MSSLNYLVVIVGHCWSSMEPTINLYGAQYILVYSISSGESLTMTTNTETHMGVMVVWRWWKIESIPQYGLHHHTNHRSNVTPFTQYSNRRPTHTHTHWHSFWCLLLSPFMIQYHPNRAPNAHDVWLLILTGKLPAICVSTLYAPYDISNVCCRLRSCAWHYSNTIEY